MIYEVPKDNYSLTLVNNTIIHTVQTVVIRSNSQNTMGPKELSRIRVQVFSIQLYVKGKKNIHHQVIRLLKIRMRLHSVPGQI